MKALVTGANGFTGSHLVKALLARGDSVVAVVRRSSELSRLVGCDVEYVYSDLTNATQIRSPDRTALQTAMVGIDVVFHTAAYVELGLVDSAKMAKVNIEGTRSVLESAQAAQVPKMVYCSTIGIFGDTQGRCVDETFQRSQKSFSSAYDLTKYKAQQLIDRAVQDGFPVVSVMPSGIFGPDDPHFGPVVQAFCQRKLKVWAGGDRVTGIVHVDDLVSGMLLAAQKGQVGEYYILSAGELTTRQMFATFSQETGIPQPWEAPPRLVRVVALILDTIGRLIKWQPPIDLERVHYLYDRAVRVDATKARQELGWQPRSAETTIQDLVQPFMQKDVEPIALDPQPLDPPIGD